MIIRVVPSDVLSLGWRTVGGCAPDPKLGRSSEGDLGHSSMSLIMFNMILYIVTFKLVVRVCEGDAQQRLLDSDELPSYISTLISPPPLQYDATTSAASHLCMQVT